MPKAIVMRSSGSPNVLKCENIPNPRDPGVGQILIRQTHVGLNYIDVHYRNGSLNVPRFPIIPGIEAAGYVESVGDRVEGFKEGQAISYCTAKGGAYAEKRLLSHELAIALPDFITPEMSVACLAKGMTAHMLIFRTFNVRKGDVILVHAAAGGVGSVICQWAKHKGATVIGTVGSEEKANFAKSHGCDYTIIYSKESVVEKVLAITNNVGVKVVYDSVGAATFQDSIKCLSVLGILVSYGQSSGPPPSFDMKTLSPKGLFVTRPSLHLYKRSRMELLLTALEVFAAVHQGIIKTDLQKRFTLENAANAHQEMEERATIGSNALVV